MNRTEKMNWLINELIRDNPQYQDISLPDTEEQAWRLLRSLMNVRHPGPVSRRFLQLQDRLLRALNEEKGIVDAGTLPAVPENPKLALWQGDITALKIDAIVNAANSAMLGCFQPCHNCIDNVIHTYAGVQLRQECAALMQEEALHPGSTATEAGMGPEPTGSAKITKGYNLPCWYILHTVGPIISGFTVTKEDDRLLASCYRSCLELAAEHRLESIAFCCISTGVFRFPKERAARIAVETVQGYLAADTSVRKVVFNVFTEEDHSIYQRILGAAQ